MGWSRGCLCLYPGLSRRAQVCPCPRGLQPAFGCLQFLPLILQGCLSGQAGPCGVPQCWAPAGTDFSAGCRVPSAGAAPRSREGPHCPFQGCPPAPAGGVGRCVWGGVQGTDTECVVADDEVMLSVVTGWRANLGRD